MLQIKITQSQYTGTRPAIPSVDPVTEKPKHLAGKPLANHFF